MLVSTTWRNRNATDLHYSRRLASMSGCAVCIYDLYFESKQAYRATLASALTKLEQMRIPPDTWPKELIALHNSHTPRTQPHANATAFSGMGGGDTHHNIGGSAEDEEDSALMASMNAFLELEKRLKQAASSNVKS